MSNATTAVEVDRFLDDAFKAYMVQFMKEISEKVSPLDPKDPSTLALIITKLTKIPGIDQGEIAAYLKQSRVQIGRWSRGDHVPKNEGYRAFLVEELLKFVQEKERAMEAA